MDKTTLLTFTSLLALCACALAQATPAPASGAAFDLAESIQRGKALYLKTCVACHQPNGGGLPGAFPPLAGSEIATGEARRMLAAVLKGVQGPLKVKNVSYNNVMIAVDTQFPVYKDDAKLADVVNYARNSFGNKDEKGVTPEMVAEVRKEFATRTKPWTEDELSKFPEQAK